ncbi:MAG: hypothetical protein ACKVZJ_13615 [Phycisphaerales bacterium]
MSRANADRCVSARPDLTLWQVEFVCEQGRSRGDNPAALMKFLLGKPTDEWNGWEGFRRKKRLRALDAAYDYPDQHHRHGKPDPQRYVLNREKVLLPVWRKPSDADASEALTDLELEGLDSKSAFMCLLKRAYELHPDPASIQRAHQERESEQAPHLAVNASDATDLTAVPTT